MTAAITNLHAAPGDAARDSIDLIGVKSAPSARRRRCRRSRPGSPAATRRSSAWPMRICLVRANSDAAFREVYRRAGMTVADGAPLAWLARLLGETRVERLRGADLMTQVAALSAPKRWRHFFLGGADGVAQRLAESLRIAHPGLVVAGCLAPPFHALTALEDAAIIAQVNAARPDIVWVGLGAPPKQEFWMAHHLGRIEAP